MNTVNLLLMGALAMGTLLVGVIFLRLWRESRDRFFLFFALSFFVQAVNRVSLAMEASPNEGSPWHYWVRFLAYVLILIAILEKNRAPGRSRSGA